jgi:hypothetical protein
MITGNFFAFNSEDEYVELFNNDDQPKWKYVEGKGKPGTIISPRLKKHWFKNLDACKNQKFVIVYSRWSVGEYRKSKKWPTTFGGDCLVIVDALDKICCLPPYMEWCLESGRGIMLKKNLSYNEYYQRWQQKKTRRGDWPKMSVAAYKDLYFNSLGKTLFVHPETPPAGNVGAIMHKDWRFRPFDKRKYDVFFAGQTRAGYLIGSKTAGIRELKAALKKSKLRGLVISKSDNLGRFGYMDTIANTCFCFNFSIGPLRNRREWEVLLGGSCLLQDPKTRDMETNIMVENEHYVHFESGRIKQQLEQLADNRDYYEGIGHNAFRMAQESFLNMPPLDIRLAMMYALERKPIDTIDELKALEKARWGSDIHDKMWH